MQKKMKKSFNGSLPNVFSGIGVMDNNGEDERERRQPRLLVKSRSFNVLPNSNPVGDCPEENLQADQNDLNNEKMLFTNEELAELGVNYDDDIEQNSMNFNGETSEIGKEKVVDGRRSEMKNDERYDSRENLADYLHSVDEIPLENENFPSVSSENDEIEQNFDENVDNFHHINGENDEKEEEIDDSPPKFNENSSPAIDFRLKNQFVTPEIHRRSRTDRASMPTIMHSWSHLDIPHSMSQPERLYPTVDDDVFEETFNASKMQRVASISSINVERREDSGTENRRNSHEKSPEDDDSAQICDSSANLTVPPLERLLSISTPSINEVEPINFEETSNEDIKIDDFEQAEDVGGEQGSPVSPKKLTRTINSRGASMYVPHITPRIPLMGLMPNSVRRNAEKTNEAKDKSKESRRSGFFGQRNKSKDLEKHSWTKISYSCDCCAKSFADSDIFQCGDCNVTCHLKCKDEFDKTSCTKNKNVKTPKLTSGSVKHQASLNIPSRPPAVGRFSSLREDSTEEKFDYAESRIVSPGFPSGFYASTMPHSDWESSLALWVEEPEPWSDTVGKNEKRKLPSKEVKRQNTIHDLYVTEKHHCQTLVVLKHTYFDEMALRCMVPTDELHKLMPCLSDLLSIHMNFLRLLKKRKDESVVVGAVHDDFLAQFNGAMGDKMTTAYTAFCSQKDTAVRFYNVQIKENVEFMNFISRINSSGFYKTLSLPDCLLRITQRLSKYHQFVESLRKNTSDDATQKDGIINAEKAVKDLIMTVDLGIEKIQMQDFRLKLYNEMDPRDVTHRLVSQNEKVLFTPQEIISDKRTLLHYVNVQWPNAKRHSADVLLLVFSDVIVFLQGSHSKQYTFFNQDGKAGVVSIRKMIVRDKAGKLGSEGVYLIATHPKPEMYEVRCKTKKDNLALMNRIQKAVQSVVDDVDEVSKILPTSPIDNNYQILEELRKLHISLDIKKKEISAMLEEKQFELSCRERILNEREAKLEWEDNELRARWGALYHREQQRFGCLPGSPLTPPTSNGVSPSSDYQTVAAPSAYYPNHPPTPRMPPPPQYYPPPSYYHQGPPPPPMMHYRTHSEDVPQNFRGALLHNSGGGPAPVQEMPKGLPKGLDKLRGSSSSKPKKSNSNQMFPDKLKKK